MPEKRYVWGKPAWILFMGGGSLIPLPLIQDRCKPETRTPLLNSAITRYDHVSHLDGSHQHYCKRLPPKLKNNPGYLAGSGWNWWTERKNIDPYGVNWSKYSKGQKWCRAAGIIMRWVYLGNFNNHMLFTCTIPTSVIFQKCILGL